jgi:hypothetical protein
MWLGAKPLNQPYKSNAEYPIGAEKRRLKEESFGIFPAVLSQDMPHSVDRSGRVR